MTTSGTMGPRSCEAPQSDQGDLQAPEAERASAAAEPPAASGHRSCRGNAVADQGDHVRPEGWLGRRDGPDFVAVPGLSRPRIGSKRLKGCA